MSEGLPRSDVKEVLGQTTVTGIFRYPVKSCAGEELGTAEIISTGIKHDRELLVVTAVETSRYPQGRFLTQRELPRMALIKPHVTDDALFAGAPGMSPLTIALVKEGDVQEVTIWDDRVAVIDQGERANEWFSQFLQTDVKLVRMPDAAVRNVGEFAPRAEDQVRFADRYNFLFLSEDSLADLNQRLVEKGLEPVPMNRFRPNVVLDGSGIPYAEDMMQRVEIDGVTFNMVKPCGRCEITTTEQTTGIRSSLQEPLRTLAQYRTREFVPGNKNAMFGQNVVHENTGVIRVGSSVKIL